ncbi:hypothetical protein BpHYR1_002670 [Brachionus plicatilis]|uniref:Uncharacterized protein n=1 Tax=Brachionus plicatilis TaxID=10195 RepID=A0A3M7RM32_BRAPC|nr:hypothetical protein BpHYR1_002670 [Brachionus plicatilis]
MARPAAKNLDREVGRPNQKRMTKFAIKPYQRKIFPLEDLNVIFENILPLILSDRQSGRPSLFWPASSAVQIFDRRPGRQSSRPPL